MSGHVIVIGTLVQQCAPSGGALHQLGPSVQPASGVNIQYNSGFDE